MRALSHLPRRWKHTGESPIIVAPDAPLTVRRAYYRCDRCWTLYLAPRRRGGLVCLQRRCDGVCDPAATLIEDVLGRLAIATAANEADR